MKGAKIILSSDPWLSPAVAVADAVLPAQVRSPSPFDSLTPAVAVVETLIAAVVERAGETGRRRVVAYDRIEGDIVTDDERPAVPHL